MGPGCSTVQPMSAPKPSLWHVGGQSERAKYTVCVGESHVPVAACCSASASTRNGAAPAAPHTSVCHVARRHASTPATATASTTPSR